MVKLFAELVIPDYTPLLFGIYGQVVHISYIIVNMNVAHVSQTGP
jgi:hypothetical protein